MEESKLIIIFYSPMRPKFIAPTLPQVLLAPILDLLWMSANLISKF